MRIEVNWTLQSQLLPWCEFIKKWYLVFSLGQTVWKSRGIGDEECWVLLKISQSGGGGGCGSQAIKMQRDKHCVENSLEPWELRVGGMMEFSGSC